MYKQTKRQVKHILIKFYIISGVLFMLLLSMIYFSPRLIAGFQDKNFPEDLSIMEIDMPETPGDFMQGMESIENVLHSYDSHMLIEDTSSQTGINKLVLISYIPHEFFNLGLPVDASYHSHEFIDIELLKGEPIEQPDEVVIDATLAIELFNHVDVVGNTITYQGQSYVISGVMNDIPGYDILTSVNHIYGTNTFYYQGYKIFLDTTYKNSLYDLGGFELLSRVESMEQQYQMNETLSEVNFYILISFISIFSIIKYAIFQKIKNDLENESNNKTFIKQIIEFSVIICAIICLAWVKLASTTSFYIAFHETFNIIIKHIWAINLYLIPISIYFINNLDFMKRSEVVYDSQE